MTDPIHVLVVDVDPRDLGALLTALEKAGGIVVSCYTRTVRDRLLTKIDACVVVYRRTAGPWSTEAEIR